MKEEDAFGPSKWSEDDDEADPEDDGGSTDKDPRIIHACTVARQQGVKYCMCMWSSTDCKRRAVPFQNPNVVACLEECGRCLAWDWTGLIRWLLDLDHQLEA